MIASSGILASSAHMRPSSKAVTPVVSGQPTCCTGCTEFLVTGGPSATGAGQGLCANGVADE